MARPFRMLLLPVLLLIALPAISGCSSGPDVEMVVVHGTVKFGDGTVPQGEVATVNFEPIAGGPNQIRKLAYGEIKPDGSFEMTTVKPGDGAIAGKYKVLFTIHKTYLGQESLVPEKYTRPETTPIEITVEEGMEMPNWVIDKQ